MPRNLDNRLEIVVPVDDSRARQRINAMFDALLSDNTNSWELNGDGTWDRVRPKKDDPRSPHRRLMMRSAIARARRTVADAARRLDADLAADQNGAPMRVAVIDVGSNTVRLLVATTKDGVVKPVHEERTAVGLARDIERSGRIPGAKIEQAAQVARRYARDAAEAPGRAGGHPRDRSRSSERERRRPHRRDLGLDRAAGEGAERRGGGAPCVLRGRRLASGAAGEPRRMRRWRRLDAARVRDSRGARVVPHARHRLAAARPEVPRR